MIARLTVLVLFAAVLAAPFLFRPREEPRHDNALTLIIVTPHNEQIRHEYGRAFDRWVSRHFARWPETVQRELLVEGGLIEPSVDSLERWMSTHESVHVNVVFNVPGGTSEIRKMLEAQFTAALSSGRAPGGNADLVFGGGSYEHDRKLKRGVLIGSGDDARRESISAVVGFDDAFLEEVYGGRTVIGSVPLYDPDRQWFGTALSGFGIVYNRDVLRRLDVPDPRSWSDLCNPVLRDWVALVNPAQSGSITTAFEAILQRRGWEDGWRILRRAAANARYFSASSQQPPTDVSQGDAAMGVCIDFYGRYQSQAIKTVGDADRVGYVDPPGVSTIDPDPISMLRGAPHPRLARRFIEFCLSEEGQLLWQYPVTDERADGPHLYELRRMPIRASTYEAERFQHFVDQVRPYELATAVEARDERAFVAVLFRAMAMDNHELLQEAWGAITRHDSYPFPDLDVHDRFLVSAADVTDPVLAEMLTLFDAVPAVPGPAGVSFDLADPEHRAAVSEGWFQSAWKDEGLWAAESTPADAMRRTFAARFAGNYERIISLARGSPARGAP